MANDDPTEPQLDSGDAIPTPPEPGDWAVHPPERIGDYRILSVLGSGGMAIVFEAEQQNPRRHVALKLIRSALVSAEELRRFRHEAQVLAWLSHPGIATVFEAGTADTGHGHQPFLAMELVHGLRLDRYVERHQPTVDERLRLLARICDAVQHAHQKGVIHRDLKPANILVDAKGRPKVLDFGLARITNSDLEVSTRQTDAGQILGTLPYMSPEQVQSDPSQVDTRADIYALGVIAYEILTGKRPLDVSSKSFHAAFHIITGQEPSSISSLDKRFRGDVETIVHKALAKEKERRYSSAEELGRDIRRYLDNEPILARPASRVYQLRKFARRNKVLVGGVTAVFVVLLAGLITSTTLYFEKERQRVDAVEARKNEANQLEVAQASLARAVEAEAVAKNAEVVAREAEGQAKAAAELAREEQATAEAVTEFLVGMFEHANPDAADQEDLTAREILDRGAQRIRTELVDQPAVRARLLDVFGKIYNWLRLWEVSEPLLAEALSLNRVIHGEDSVPYAATLERLAFVRQIQGDLATAEEMLRQVLDLRIRHLGPGSKPTTDAMSNLAGTLSALKRDAEAEELYLEALELRREAFGAASVPAAVIEANLGALYIGVGRLAAAEELLLSAVETFERELGAAHWRTLFVHGTLADALVRAGRHAEAVPHARSAYAGFVENYGTSSEDSYRYGKLLGDALAESGQPSEAATVFRELLPAHEALYGRDRYHVELRWDLANALHAAGGHDAAEELYIEVAGEVEELFGPTDGRSLAVQFDLARLMLETERFEEAEAFLLVVWEARSSGNAFGADYTRSVPPLLVELYEAWGQPEEANTWREKDTGRPVEASGSR